jgi:hypothetical protein
VNTAFIRLSNDRYINMALVADVQRADGYLNLYPAIGLQTDRTPATLAHFPADSADARIVLEWLEGHSDFVETP